MVYTRTYQHTRTKKAKIRKCVSKGTGTKTNRGQHEYTKLRQPIGPLLPLPPHRLRMPERSEQTHSSTGTYEGDWKGTNTQIYRKVGLGTVAGWCNQQSVALSQRHQNKDTQKLHPGCLRLVATNASASTIFASRAGSQRTLQLVWKKRTQDLLK